MLEHDKLDLTTGVCTYTQTPKDDNHRKENELLADCQLSSENTLLTGSPGPLSMSVDEPRFW